MNNYVRRGIIGIVAGGISSVLLVMTLQTLGGGILLGIGVGAIYALIFRSAPQAYIESIMVGGALGVALWGGMSTILLPIFSGHAAQWTAEEMRLLFPVLVGWVLYSAGMGLLVQLLSDLTRWRFGPERQQTVPERMIKTRIVIVGGGFAGVTAARHLERLFGPDSSVSLTIVSDVNALLFTPMLTEVAGGSLEPTHISSPLRTSLHRTQVVHGCVESIAVEQKRLWLAADGFALQRRDLSFDHLVLAVGSVSNYLGLEGVKTNAFDFKTLTDAVSLHDHVINMLEHADGEVDVLRRQALLTFVIAGAGFAGAELAGALNDFVRGTLSSYPTLLPDEVKIIVVHGRDSILPELSPSLAHYALERMIARGVTFKLNTRLVDAREGSVVLKPEEEIRTETLVWTAGVAPHPLIQTLPVGRDKRGALIVDAMLAVPDFSGFWALGDCAAVPDVRTGQTCPPTAQFAIREARTVAHNIYASVRGRPLKAFHFDALGVLCVVGYQTACAEIKGFRFSGFLAWLMWRGIYLAKLPGLERQLRVLSDWIAELFFPRDSVQTIAMDADQGRKGEMRDMKQEMRGMSSDEAR